MSDENNNEQTTEEIMEEMQALMKRQMELQAKLLNSNWNGFNDALGAFMNMFNATTQPNPAQTDTKNKEEDES